ncbi:MAG: leucyl aminopeptidase [Microbacteriaceae bacterium]|nr:leucyl aminopeptidase [Microbacteriaceae bacterium]
MISLTLSTKSDHSNIPVVSFYPEKPDQQVTQLATVSNYKNKFGEVLFLSEDIFLGVGDTELNSVNSRKLGGKLSRAVAHLQSLSLDLDLQYPQEFLEGLLLGGFDQRLYGSKEISETEVLVPANQAEAMENASLMATAVNQTRKIINTPGNHLFPESVASLASQIEGLEVEVWDEQKLIEERCGGILAVGQGSARPPRLVKLHKPGKGKKVALVGKGITFDTGGLSIKPSEGMVGMKYDMAGAATVMGVMQVLAEKETSTDVTAYLCLAENMPSGNATRPGDVITMRNGKTVEVLNTDAEGRLVMADGLSLASEENPDLIIDVATLTGAAVIALGNRYVGAMGDDVAVKQVLDASKVAGEQVWHMPLPDELAEMLESDIADLMNVKIGNRAGGMLIAGQFLAHFVGEKDARKIPWVHLDIAGAANNSSAAYDYTPKGATGVMTRSLVQLIMDIGIQE